MGIEAAPETMQRLLNEVKERSLREKRLISIEEFREMAAAGA